MKAFNSLTKAEFEKLQREYIKQAMETAQRAVPEPEPEPEKTPEPVSVSADNITEINIGSIVTGDITRTETEINTGEVSREENKVGDIEIPIETGDITRTEAEINAGDITREENKVGDIEIPIETGDITRTEISEEEAAEPTAEKPEAVPTASNEVTDKPIFETIVMESDDSGKEKLRQLLGEQAPPDFGGFIARHNKNVDGRNG